MFSYKGVSVDARSVKRSFPDTITKPIFLDRKTHRLALRAVSVAAPVWIFKRTANIPRFGARPKMNAEGRVTLENKKPKASIKTL